MQELFSPFLIFFEIIFARAMFPIETGAGHGRTV
jgi:hypothetical protein